MARKNRWWLLAAMLGLLSLAGCTGAGAGVSLGQEFQLAPGQSAIVKGEELTVRFIEVAADSRCPRGATCIRAGEAISQVEITSQGTTYPLALTQPGLSEPPKTDFKNYEITFDLRPYPQVGEELKKEDYRLQLEIVRKPA